MRPSRIHAGAPTWAMGISQHPRGVFLISELGLTQVFAGLPQRGCAKQVGTSVARPLIKESTHDCAQESTGTHRLQRPV